MLNIKLTVSVNKHEYERDRCEKSVHRCYSLVDNTSERWKKLKECKLTRKTIKIILLLLNVFSMIRNMSFV